MHSEPHRIPAYLIQNLAQEGTMLGYGLLGTVFVIVIIVWLVRRV
jgi:hypothetical protein